MIGTALAEVERDIHREKLEEAAFCRKMFSNPGPASKAPTAEEEAEEDRVFVLFNKEIAEFKKVGSSTCLEVFFRWLK